MRTAAIAALVFAVCAAAPLATARSVAVEGKSTGGRHFFDFASDALAKAEGVAESAVNKVESVFRPAAAPAHPAAAHTRPSGLGRTAAAAAVANAVDPAAQVIIRQALLDSLVPNAINLLSELATQIEIPDITVTQNVPVLGDVDITLSRIALYSLDINRDRSFIDLKYGFASLGFNDINAEIIAMWKFRQHNFPHTNGAGNAVITASRGSIASDVFVDADDEGYINLGVLESVTQFGKIDVDIRNSSWAWLLNIITDLVSGTIRNTVVNELNNLIKETLPTEANKLFHTQPMNVPVLDAFNVELGFVRPINISPENIDARNHVRISALDGTQCPYKTGLPSRNHKDSAVALSKQARIYVDQSALQCAVWAFTEKTTLKATVRQSDLPDNIVILNTDSWDEMVPIIAKLYPNRPMEVDASIVGTPQITVSRSAGAVAAVDASLDFYVIEKSGARTHLFILNAAARITLDEIKIIQSPDYTKNTVKIALEAIDIDTTIGESSVGEIDIEPIQETFEALGYLAVSVLNSDVIPQIDIPEIPYARIIKPVIEYSDGEIVVASDVGLAPN